MAIISCSYVNGFTRPACKPVYTNFSSAGIHYSEFLGSPNWKVAETRFASNTIVLKRLVKVRESLASMVISQSWSLWRQSSIERATNVKLMILDDTWWERVEYLLSFTEPIMSMIRYTDMDHPCLGEVYNGIDSMLEKMKHIINEKEQDPEETFFKEVQTICVERWNKMTTPLHLLAFALTPKFYSDEILSMPSRVPPYRDVEVSEGCRKALTKLFPDREMENIVTSEFADFVASNGQSGSALRDKYTKDAHAWWYLNGHTSPHLQTLAIKLLSQKWGISNNSQIITLRLVLLGSLSSKVRQTCKKIAITGEYPQNVDLPHSLPITKKKPFPVPVKELRRAARERQKKNKGKQRKPLGPPKNGLLVQGLIPIAHQVFEARARLVNVVSQLLKVVHVHSCRHCSEVHIGPVGHHFKTCHGYNFGARNSLHEWTNSHIEDILVPLESFHLFDRLGRRVTHEERFSIERIPSVVELCIQAGLDLPQYPTRRRVEPIYYFNKEMVDPNEDEAVNDMQKGESSEVLDLYEPTQQTSTAYPSEEIKNLAEETLQAWFTMRQGANKLMKKYPVKVCGYCPEVHVGPFGHRARLCGAHKHQQRDGMHGWQTATIDDLIPPKYVWHVPDPQGPLRNELKRFYGQAPAIVELCVQAGAAIPEEYKPMMRLDIVIPDSQEVEMVA